MIFDCICKSVLDLIIVPWEIGDCATDLELCCQAVKQPWFATSGTKLLLSSLLRDEDSPDKKRWILVPGCGMLWRFLETQGPAGY